MTSIVQTMKLTNGFLIYIKKRIKICKKQDIFQIDLNVYSHGKLFLLIVFLHEQARS